MMAEKDFDPGTSSSTEGSQNKQLALEAVRSLPGGKTVSPSSRSEREGAIGFAYLRVSTREQARTGGGAEGYSIPAQREACLVKAQQMRVTIQAEYIDAGESARSTDRDDLQRMLRDIKKVRPDYVFVHKIDRLARNREDDIAINLLLRKHGVKLISCTENIDDTPSGKLLYGLMAEIAQFYSANLAQEVLKGLRRKAEEGGTPFRAPLGYTNRREKRGGVEFSWVELDPERAKIIKWCFEQYATGEWSVADLVLAARKKGLTTRATGTKPESEVGLTTMYSVLRNPYYMGLVPYQGIHYEGKHPTLIEPDAWLAVQHILESHNHTGEKDRIHTHYLRSTIYCSSCSGRLVFSANTGNGGTYVYFMCVKKKTKTNNCRRPAVRVERIEQGISNFYGRFKIRSEHSEQICTAVREELANQQAEASRGLDRATRRKARALDERQKLLQAHYAGAVPQDLLASEMQRLTRALVEIEAEIKAAKTTATDVEATLRQALAAARHCEQAYLTAPDQIKRQINQGFFEKLFIGEDGTVVRAELTEPFAALLEEMPIARPSGSSADNPPSAPQTDPGGSQMAVGPLGRPVFHNPARAVTESGNDNTFRSVVSFASGLNDECLVPPTGLEPALNRF
ncbi:recombinase [Amycolatopsis acidiphila]|uniref:Recombinase family protein n=1 Tax=Amycolatopsis acidiphila TaxID=715473 RepID=A0A558A910_9PSEU|nr:recombinase family protein [Amycolatopsis acidiphila]GHG73423.1 recombinase [Amycolatopsis acidiphila]